MTGIFGVPWGDLAAISTVCGFGGGFIYILLLPKFVTHEYLKKYCQEHQGACESLMCTKIDQIKAEITVMDEKRENARKEQSEQLEKIHTFIGRVDQFMQERMK